MSTHNEDKGSPQGPRRGPSKKSHSEVINDRLERLLNPRKYNEPAQDWDLTEPKNPLTLDDFISLKPFKMEDLKEMIAFRAPDKVFRTAQRIKEKAGGVYDIMSDLHRDIYFLGLMIMSERYTDILGVEILIERAKDRVESLKLIDDQVHRMALMLANENEKDQRVDYVVFLETIKGYSVRKQEAYAAAVDKEPILAALRKRMAAQAEHQEE